MPSLGVAGYRIAMAGNVARVSENTWGGVWGTWHKGGQNETDHRPCSKSYRRILAMSPSSQRLVRLVLDVRSWSNCRMCPSHRLLRRDGACDGQEAAVSQLAIKGIETLRHCGATG
jgi:hypothetical protein